MLKWLRALDVHTSSIRRYGQPEAQREKYEGHGEEAIRYDAGHADDAVTPARTAQVSGCRVAKLLTDVSVPDTALKEIDALRAKKWAPTNVLLIGGAEMGDLKIAFGGGRPK